MDRFTIISTGTRRLAEDEHAASTRRQLEAQAAPLREVVRAESRRWREMDAPLEYTSHQATLLELVIEHGQACISRPRPKRIRLRPACSPFLSAWEGTSLPDASEQDRRVYVEGFAWEEGQRPRLHAWTVDLSLRVIDRSSPHPERCSYIGLPLDFCAVSRMVNYEFNFRMGSVLQQIVVTGRLGKIDEFKLKAEETSTDDGERWRFDDLADRLPEG